MSDLDFLFRPKTIAVIGASKDPTKRGYQSIRSLQEGGFTGTIFPVNPREKEILGLPVHAKTSEIDSVIDLALISTPASTVPGILEDCGKKGVRSAVVLSVGFGESGTNGRKLQEEVVRIAKERQIRIVGPNTSGIFNLHHHMNLVGIRNVRRGSIAILSQSGNLALSLITEMSVRSHLGVSAYVGVGNEADIRFHEYLNYFRDDPDTRVIVVFADGMKDGRKFLQVAKQTVEEKPIVLLRSGRSELGRKAARSHTGALAGLSAVSRTAFRRAGIITIERSDELLPAAEALNCQPPIRHNRVAILSDGGGHAALAADALAEQFVNLPELSDETTQKLRTIMPETTTIANPIDVAGATDSNPGVFADCAQVLLEDPSIDALLIIGLFGGYHIRFDESLKQLEEETSHRIGKLSKSLNKAVVIQSLYADQQPSPLRIAGSYEIPVHESIDLAAKCISVLEEYGHHLSTSHDRTDFTLNPEGKRRPEAEGIINMVLSQRRTNLLETEAKSILRVHGVQVADFQTAADEEEAVEMARDIGYPVVMKIVSPEILHKTEIGGVLLNVKNEDAVRDGYDLLVARARRHNPSAKIHGVVLSPQMPSGIEVVVGVTQDPQFGPVMMFGLGGIMVEVLKDVSFRVIPLSTYPAEMMLREIKSRAILDGVRGKPGCDREALIQLMVQVSDLAEAYPELAEMDLNPIICYENGLSVVDARMVLREPAEAK